MGALIICSDFGAQENKVSLFPLFPHLFAMKWWDQMPWSLFFECWVLSQIFILINFCLYSKWQWFILLNFISGRRRTLYSETLDHHFIVLPPFIDSMGASQVARGKESTSQCRRCRRHGVRSLSQEDPLQEEMASHSSILPRKICDWQYDHG